MTKPLLMVALFGSIVLAALAQLLLKLGMSTDAVQRALAEPGQPLTERLLAVALSPLVIAGLVCFGASALSWLLVLARMELSSAYPFAALGMVLTVGAGVLLLGESLSAAKLGGVVLIICGTALLGWSTIGD